MKNELEMFDLDRLSEYNKTLENRHITNMKKIENLKKLYITRLSQIEDKNKKLIKEKNGIIERLNIQIKALEEQRRILKEELSKVPEDVLRKYN